MSIEGQMTPSLNDMSGLDCNLHEGEWGMRVTPIAIPISKHSHTTTMVAGTSDKTW